MLGTKKKWKKNVPHVHLRSALEHVQEYEFSRLPATYFQRQQQKVQKKTNQKHSFRAAPLFDILKIRSCNCQPEKAGFMTSHAL
jgi:hypothetical protein